MQQVYVVSVTEYMGDGILSKKPMEFCTTSHEEAQKVLGECLMVKSLHAEGKLGALHEMLSRHENSLLFNNLTIRLMDIACWERYGFTTPSMKTVPKELLTPNQRKKLSNL